MYRFFLFLTVISAGLLACNGKDQNAPVKRAKSKYSQAFNQDIDAAMNVYYNMTEAFVNWDSVAVARQGVELAQKIKKISLQEVGKDTALVETAITSRDNMLEDLKQITAKNDLVEKRHGLNSFTQNLYDFLRAIQYDENKLYLDKCDMAFNDNDPGLWISRNDTIRNPYMGLHHPHYGKAMIDCGENKSTIDFTAAPPAAKNVNTHGNDEQAGKK
jgi:hypothetical protein